MNLELKHLSPFLPYGLKMIFEGKGGRIIEVTGLRVAGISEKTSNLLYFNSISETLVVGYFKPILRPISDIHKELFIDGNFGFIPINRFLGEDSDLILNAIQIKDLSFIPYNLINKLFEWHFDVFGLIPAGLAVSIHDVGQVVA